MSVFNDLRQRFLRKKSSPVAAKESPLSMAAKPAAPAAVAPPPPRPVAPVSPPAPARDLESERKNLEKLLGEIDNRFGKQRAETERLVQPIQDLPGAVQAITEVKTQCGRMLEMISSHVEGQRDQGQELDASVGRLRDASSQQARMLETIRSQVEMNTQAIKHSAETYEAVIQHVGEVHKACCKLQESLATIASGAQGTTSEVTEALAQQQRTMKLVAIGAGGAAVVALVVAVISLL